METVRVKMQKINTIFREGYQPIMRNNTELVAWLNRHPEITTVELITEAIPEVAERELQRTARRAVKIAAEVGGTLSDLVVVREGYCYSQTVTR